MMYEKRIKNLKRIISKLRLLLSSFEKEATPRMGFKEIRWAITCAIECVEKQIPKKPIEYEDKYYACPSCQGTVMYKWDEYPTKLKSKKYGLPYCLGCGQALDWSEEDECS